MDQTLATFLMLVAAAVFIIFQALAVPAFGTTRQEMTRIRKRVNAGVAEKQSKVDVDRIHLLREKFRREQSPLEHILYFLPGFRKFYAESEKTGRPLPDIRYAGISILMAVAGGLMSWYLSQNVWLSGVFAALLGSLPFYKLRHDQAKRFDMFEQQLPDALEMITRALRSGYPFSDSLRVVAEEMEEPISSEFGITFGEINAGIDTRVAMMNLLDRVPSVSLMAMVTTVALQKETGGNLSETLQNISSVIRGRFKFQRDVRTITAEGRISAWVMTLLPFGLFLFLYVSNKDYVSNLFTDPTGQKMVLGGLGLLVLGSLWLRKLINFEV